VRAARYARATPATRNDCQAIFHISFHPLVHPLPALQRAAHAVSGLGELRGMESADSSGPSTSSGQAICARYTRTARSCPTCRAFTRSVRPQLRRSSIYLTASAPIAIDTSIARINLLQAVYHTYCKHRNLSAFVLGSPRARRKGWPQRGQTAAPSALENQIRRSARDAVAIASRQKVEMCPLNPEVLS